MMKPQSTKFQKHRQLLIVVVVAVIMSVTYVVARLGLAGPLGADWPGGNFASITKPTAAYWIEGVDSDITSEVRKRIVATGFMPAAATSADTADIVFSRGPRPGAAGILTETTGRPAATVGTILVETSEAPTLYLSAGAGHKLSENDLKKLTTDIAGNLTKAGGKVEWTLAAVGDVIIGRTVYTQMRKYGDMQRPFAYFAERLAGSDLALANLECAFSDTNPVIADSGMTFVSPMAATAGLKSSGIDAVNISNNHSFNGGAAGFTGTLDQMNTLGITTFGGGRSDAEAHSPHIMNVQGTKVALLGYSSIVGSQPAGANTPGMAYISMAPWGPLSEPDVARMEQDIQAAKTQADVVLVYFHWGQEYTHDPNADQRTVAHRAIDAGADLILGTHPHWVQGVEWYKDRLITYSLGNFIFDQAWAPETMQGTFLSATFENKRLIKAELVPYQIADYMQPRPANPSVSAAILGDIAAHSWWPLSQN